MDEEKIEALRRRYFDAAHAMQSGVKMMMERGSDFTEPKHLRVGINSALRDIGTLCQLLVEKGVVTEIELWTALTTGMEIEKASYELEVRAAYGNSDIYLA